MSTDNSPQYPQQKVVDPEIRDFLSNLGFKSVAIHRSFDHFDFSRGSRIILVIGPMGSGKTEFVARVWRDAQVAKRKSDKIAALTTTGHGADRRNIFVVKNKLDTVRFSDNPSNSLSFRNGYIDCGTSIGDIENSFDLETLINNNPQCGVWIVDEAGFYDERIAFIMRKYALEKELVFICPTLSLNFRRTIFNTTASFLVEYASDVFPLTAYCEDEGCLQNAVYSYRYYHIPGTVDKKVPALYFDPLIMVGGDTVRSGDYQPNYGVRCAEHHFLPGKEYTYMVLKPYAKTAMHSNRKPLMDELSAIMHQSTDSKLYQDFSTRYRDNRVKMNYAFAALSIRSIAERALIYLYSEVNLIDIDLLRYFADTLSLDKGYIERILAENGIRIRM